MKKFYWALIILFLFGFYWLVDWWQNVPRPYTKVVPTQEQQKRINWALSYHGNYTIVTTPTEFYMITDKGRVRL